MWAAKDESRRELTYGMLLLLGGIAGDDDGSDTLELMESFEEIYFTTLTRSDYACGLAVAIRRLDRAAKTLERLVRS